MAVNTQTETDSRRTDSSNPANDEQTIEHGPLSTRPEGVDLSTSKEWSEFRGAVDRIISAYEKSERPAEATAADDLRTNLKAASDLLSSWTSTSDFSEAQRHIDEIYTILEEQQLETPSSLQVSEAASKNASFPLAVAVSVERPFEANFEVKGTRKFSYPGSISGISTIDYDITPGRLIGQQRVSASEYERVARVEIDTTGKNYVVRFDPEFTGAVHITVGEEVLTISSDGENLTHQGGNTSLNVDQKSLLDSLKNEAEIAETPAAFALHHFPRASGFELSGRMTDEHFVVTATKDGKATHPPLYLAKSLGLTDAKAALASYLSFASTNGKGLIHNKAPEATPLAIAASSPLHGVLLEQQKSSTGVRLAYLGSEDGTSTYRFFQTTRIENGIQLPPRWIGDEVAVDDRLGVAQRNHLLQKAIQDQKLVERAAQPPVYIGNNSSGPQFIDALEHSKEVYDSLTRAQEHGFTVRTAENDSIAILYRGHEVLPRLDIPENGDLSSLSTRLNELMEDPPIVQARLEEIAASAGFTLTIEAGSEQQLLYLNRNGKRVVPPLVHAKSAKAAEVEEQLTQFVEANSKSDGHSITSAVDGLASRDLSAEDGRLYTILRDERNSGDGHVALALVGVDGESTKYRLFQTAHTIDERDVAARWLSEEIEIAHDDLSSGFERVAILAADAIEKTNLPGLVIQHRSAGSKPLLVDRITTDRETYESIQKATAQGLSVVQLDDTKFQVQYEGSDLSEPFEAKGSREQQIREIAATLDVHSENLPLPIGSIVEGSNTLPIDRQTGLPPDADQEISPYEVYQRAIEKGYVVELVSDKTKDDTRSITFRISLRDAESGKLREIGNRIVIDRGDPHYFARRNYDIATALAVHLEHPPIEASSEVEGKTVRPIDYITAPDLWTALNKSEGVTIAHSASYKHDSGYQHEYQLRSGDPDAEPVTLRVLSGVDYQQRRNHLLLEQLQATENGAELTTTELPFADASQPPAMLHNAPGVAALLDQVRDAGMNLKIEAVTATEYLLRLHSSADDKPVGMSVLVPRKVLESPQENQQVLIERTQDRLKQVDSSTRSVAQAERIVVDFEGTTAGYRSIVRGQLAILPAEMLRDLQRYGVSFRAQRTLMQETGLTGQPRGWPKDTVWAEVGGAYRPTQKEVLLAEKIYEPETDSWSIAHRYPHTLLHEAGHAVDHMLGERQPKELREYIAHNHYRIVSNPVYKHGISSSPEFIAAYEKDRAIIEASDKSKSFKYFLQEKNGDRHAGRQETFAEGFNVIMEGPSAISYQKFQTNFPTVLKEMKRILQAHGYAVPGETDGGTHIAAN